MNELRLIMSSVVSALVAAAAITASARVHADEPAAAVAAASEQQTAGRRSLASTTADDVLDRISLDSTAITGNRELPKVMSIVPWKAAEPPAGPDRPMGSLIEELLAPVDRDEFRREITYYHGLTTQSSARDGQASASPAAAVAPQSQRSTTSGASGASSQ